MAIIADEIEKITAPFASPEPFLRAKSQKVLAAIYAKSEPDASVQPPLIDHDVAKMSAMHSKRIRMPNGISQFIL